MIKDATAEHILDRLSDLKNYPREVLRLTRSSR
jgi:hypothetical protein